MSSSHPIWPRNDFALARQSKSAIGNHFPLPEAMDVVPVVGGVPSAVTPWIPAASRTGWRQLLAPVCRTPLHLTRHWSGRGPPRYKLSALIASHFCIAMGGLSEDAVGQGRAFNGCRWPAPSQSLLLQIADSFDAVPKSVRAVPISAVSICAKIREQKLGPTR